MQTALCLLLGGGKKGCRRYERLAGLSEIIGRQRGVQPHACVGCNKSEAVRAGDRQDTRRGRRIVIHRAGADGAI